MLTVVQPQHRQRQLHRRSQTLSRAALRLTASSGRSGSQSLCATTLTSSSLSASKRQGPEATVDASRPLPRCAVAARRGRHIALSSRALRAVNERRIRAQWSSSAPSEQTQEVFSDYRASDETRRH